MKYVTDLFVLAPGMSASSFKSTADALSRKFFQLAKRNKGLPPQIQLTVVIPSSSTVGSRNFILIKSFVKHLVQEFSVSPSGTRVAMVTHSSAPRLDFHAHQFVNMECTLRGISSIRFTPGQKSPLHALLKFIKPKLYPNLSKAEGPARRILFIIAESSDFSSEASLVLRARTLKDQGVEVFLLIVGKYVTNSLPNKVASEPFQGHVFQVRSFSDLTRLSRAFTGTGFNHSCSGEGLVFDECNRRCICRDGRPTDCYRIRKEFTEMTFEERRRYLRVFKMASKKSPFRKTYDIVTKLHAKFFDDIHEKELFFTWHRWYLLVFENLLHHLDCRVTVPYWDWARAVSRKRLFRHTGIRDIWNSGPHGLGGNGTLRSHCVQSGLFKVGLWSLPAWLGSGCLSRVFDNRIRLPGEWYVKNLNKLQWDEFNDFEEAVSDGMHNDLHNAIGGTMSEDASSVAPEFWLHHAFLDKIWSNWQDRGPRYKFAYYMNIKRRLPGSAHFGWEFMDLQNQPHCVKVLYEETRDEEIPVPAKEWTSNYGNYESEDDDSDDVDDEDNEDDETFGDEVNVD